jgi:hypothetical protein
MTHVLGSAAVGFRATPREFAGGTQAWSKLRSDWITGPRRSLRSFAASRGVSYSTLLRHARTERWQRDRAEAERHRMQRDFARSVQRSVLETLTAMDRLRRTCRGRRRPAAELAQSARTVARAAATLATHAEWLAESQ